MIIKEMKYSLNDVMIIPSAVSDIRSRKECNVYYNNNKLPIFTAPMSTVISDNNYCKFSECGINTIIPRSINFDVRLPLAEKSFIAISLNELYEMISNIKYEHLYKKPIKICVDIANGHMKSLLEGASAFKKLYVNSELMIGNIANSKILEYIIKDYAADYIRIGIGGGSRCITSANCGVHYPMASLIEECKLITNHYKKLKYKIPKIVADGGFDNYDKIIKALAIGADYVMCGSIFAKAEEATAPIIIKNNIKYRNYYGMSTRKAQKELGNTMLKTSEGIEKLIPIEYTINQWVDNFISYLKSAMSYTNKKNINDFVGNVELCLISSNAKNVITK